MKGPRALATKVTLEVTALLIELLDTVSQLAGKVIVPGPGTV